jgi:hypothetical protein
LTISLAGSTSSSGTGLRPSSSGALDREHPADGEDLLGLLVDDFREGAVLVARIAAHRVLQRRDRSRAPMACASRGSAKQISPPDKSRPCLSTGTSPNASRWRHAGSPPRISSSPTTSMRVAGSEEEFADEVRLYPTPTASKICRPLVGLDTSEMPILDIP